MNDSPLALRSLPMSFRRSMRGRGIALVTAMAGLLAGPACSTQPQTFPASDTTKYTLENTDRFIVMDRSPVSCTGLQHHALADGRLEVVANLRNRDSRRTEVQASCAFKDEQGSLLIEETPWKTVTIAENATEAVRFTASNPASKKYTIRVRQVR